MRFPLFPIQFNQFYFLTGKWYKFSTTFDYKNMMQSIVVNMYKTVEGGASHLSGFLVSVRKRPALVS